MMPDKKMPFAAVLSQGRKKSMTENMSHHPLYIQIAELFRENIRLGKWPQGTRIPAELKLSEDYHVSRITIRKAIDELVRERLLLRHRGKGTFVNEYSADTTEYSTLAKSFTRELLEQGKTVQTLWATVEKVPANAQIAANLQIPLGSLVLALTRLRGTEDGLVGLFKTFVPYRPFLSLSANDYLGSFYNQLKRHGLLMTNQQEYVEAMMPTKELQKILKITKDEPILKRVRFTAANESFREYTECYYIGKKYRYYLDFSTFL